MLDRDLAAMYGVETKALNQAVKRNSKRFEGDDFMFRLTKDEAELARSRSQIVTLESPANKGLLEDSTSSRSQIVTMNKGRGSNTCLPDTVTKRVLPHFLEVLWYQCAATALGLRCTSLEVISNALARHSTCFSTFLSSLSSSTCLSGLAFLYLLYIRCIWGNLLFIVKDTK